MLTDGSRNIVPLSIPARVAVPLSTVSRGPAPRGWFAEPTGAVFVVYPPAYLKDTDVPFGAFEQSP